MKKFLAIIILVFVFLFTGCGVVNRVTNSMFVTVESGWDYKIVYHKDTKVMYAVSDGSSNIGTFTLLVNPDGSPMLYKESEE